MRIPNRIICSIAASAAFALSALNSQAAANLLVNPGFENAAGFTANPIHLSGENMGWATFGASQSDMSASIDSPHSGAFALLSVNGIGNNWNPQGAYQIVSGITPGQQYTFSAYFLADAVNSGTFTTPVALQLGFGNFSGTNFVDLGTVEGGVGTNSNWGFGGTPPPGSFGPAPAGSIPALNTWYQGGLTGTAPAGATDAVVYLFNMDNGQTAPQSVFFDDASLTLVVPEPSILALLGLAVPFYFIRRRRS